MRVSRLVPQRIAAEIGSALPEAIQRVLDSGCYIGGYEVEAFESECCQYLGCRAAVSCASGTDALELALRSLHLRPDSRVATTAFTFAATASAIVAAGLRPFFLDIDPDTMQICPDALRDASADGIEAVVPVSLYGRPLDSCIFDVASDAGIPVVEDACQAFGSGPPSGRTGVRATLTAFSFFPSKPLGCIGDGGMVVTSDTALAERVRSLARHGVRDQKHLPEVLGRNSRLDALQAAILRAKLPYVDHWRHRRERQSLRYRDALSSTVRVPSYSAHHAWALYTIRTQQRDELAMELRSRGVDAAVFYPTGLHMTPAFRSAVRLPNTERAASEVLSLPISASMREVEQSRVVSLVLDLAHKHGGNQG